jgi:hypothetical protein
MAVHDQHYTKGNGPLAAVYACKHCRFVLRIPKGQGGGRGQGLRTSATARGEMVRHIKTEHADKLA